MHAPLYTPLSLISPLLLFLRTQFSLKESLGPGTLLHVSRQHVSTEFIFAYALHVQMYTYRCTPICVNSVVDMGVYQFQKDLIDGLIEKAFIRGEPCQDMEAAWRRFGNCMGSAIKGLLGSPPPPCLPIAQGLLAMLDPDEAELQNEGDASGAYGYINSGADAAVGSDWSMRVLRFDQGEAAARHVFTASGMLQLPFSPFLSSSPSEASTARLMAPSLQHAYAPNGCIDPALIKSPPTISTLSAAVASMGFEAQAAPSMHAAGGIRPSSAGPIKAKSPPACPIDAKSSPARPIEAESPPSAKSVYAPE